VTDTEILVGQWGPETRLLLGAVARERICFKIINEEGGITEGNSSIFFETMLTSRQKRKPLLKSLWSR
jgi:hypothetical protein